MANKIKVRDVGLREIYDSYMGIIRISPDRDMNDDISSAFLNDSEIELSDSDGNELSLTFTGKKSQTTVLPLDKDGNKHIVNLVSVVSRVKDILFAVESVNVRSTLYLGRKDGEERDTTSLMVISKKDKDNYIRNILMYPTDSPYNSSYWNDLESKVKHSDIKQYKGEYDEQIEEYLYNQNQNFYSNIEEKHYVKVNNKTVYITNANDELIPVLYDKCCVLGNRKDATSRIPDNGTLPKYIKSFYGFKNIAKIGGPYIKPIDSYITRLSFFNVDSMIWEGIGQTMSGNIRHTSAGRYKQLGANVDTNLYEEYGIEPGDKGDYSIAKTPSRAYSFVDTAPLLGTDVEPGLIIYNAMPLKKFAYNALRQIKTNKEKKYITDFGNNINAVNVDNEFNDILTSAGSGEKTSSIRLVKNFILCDGQEISHENYPYVNGKNDMLNAFMNANSENTITTEIANTVYNYLNHTNINLLDWHSTGTRMLRGQSWQTDADEKDIDKEDVVDVNSLPALNGGTNCKVEVIEMNTYDNPYSTYKSFISSKKPYMSNYDSKICRSTHKHYMFSSEYGKNTDAVTTTTTYTTIFGIKFQVSNTSTKYTIAGQAYCRKAPGVFYDKVNVNTNILDTIPWYINSRTKNDGKFTNKLKIPLVETASSPNNLQTSLSERQKKENEINAAKPISAIGGIDFCYFENGYTVREGHNSSGHKHKTKYKNSFDKVGGYNIQAQTSYKEGDEWGEKDEEAQVERKYIEVGLTSLPYTDREKLGDGNVLIKDYNDKIKYKEEHEVGGTTIEVFNNVPSPPAINLLPLLRI